MDGNKKIKNYLPIGSIIKKNNDEYIILGRFIKKDGVMYDYLCAEYPMGFITEKDLVFINDKDIKEMKFLGNINY
jgi:hypothetical protein